MIMSYLVMTRSFSPILTGGEHVEWPSRGNNSHVPDSLRPLWKVWVKRVQPYPESRKKSKLESCWAQGKMVVLLAVLRYPCLGQVAQCLLAVVQQQVVHVCGCEVVSGRRCRGAAEEEVFFFSE